MLAAAFSASGKEIMRELKLVFAAILAVGSLSACVITTVNVVKSTSQRHFNADARSKSASEEFDDLIQKQNSQSAEQFLNNKNPLGIEQNSQLPDFGQSTILPNGLPAGAWASTLEAVPLHPDLFRDPATRKLYRLQNGAIVAETDPFADLSPEMRLNVARIQIELSERHAQTEQRDAELLEMRQANDIAGENARWQRFWQIENRTPCYSQPVELPTPVSIYGDNTRIGNTIFHDYYSSDGQQVHGNTTFIGNSAYTTIQGN